VAAPALPQDQDAAAADAGAGRGTAAARELPPFSRMASTDSVATNYLPSDPHTSRPRPMRNSGAFDVECL
jgi:hypothetical protein